MNHNLYVIKTIPLETAQTYISNYKTYVSDNNIQDPAYAFLIIHADIMHALGLTGELPDALYERFRGYIGLDNTKGMDWRLLVVAVDHDGNDVIPYQAGQAIVYDFNLPCPATCDANSPLNHNNIPPAT